MKKSLFIVSTLLLVLTTTACSNPKIKNGEKVVVEVSGKKYTADELYNELKKENGYNVAINWVDTQIAEKEVKDSKEIDNYVNEAINYYKQYAAQYGMNIADFAKSYLGINVNSEKELEEYIRKDKKLSTAVENYIAKQIKDKDAKEYYNKNYKTTYNYRIIALLEENNEKTAKDILKELKNVKSDKLESKFIELAKKYSNEPNAANGGLYENATKNTVNSKVWKAIEKLDNKKYTKEVIKDDNTIYIVYKISKGKTKEYKDVKNDIQKIMAQEKIAKDASLPYDALTALRNKYKLSFYDSDLKNSYKDYLKQVEDYKKSLKEQK